MPLTQRGPMRKNAIMTRLPFVSLRARLAEDPERVAVFLGWALVPLPAVGWIIAQSFTGRIDEVWEWSSAYVHSLAASTFAVLLLASAAVNLLVLIRRAPRRPSRGTMRYAMSQTVVIVLTLGWIACLAVGSVAQGIEMIVGASVACASIVTLAFAGTGSPAPAA